MPQFQRNRWQRAGATPEQLEDMQKAWDEYTYDEQVAESERMAGVSDEDLAAEIGTEVPASPTAEGDTSTQADENRVDQPAEEGPVAEDLTAGNIHDVLERVGDDKVAAQAVLEAEKAKGDDARTTLIDDLEKIIAAEPESSS